MKLDKPYEKQAYIDFVAWCNSNNCHIEDKGEYLESVENEPYIPPTPTTEEQIQALKNELTTYDYIGVKIAMGVATVEEYAEQIAYTETLRARINELRGELNDNA